MIIERIDQLRAGHLADIRGQEYPVQESEDQRRVLGDEQPPCRVVATLGRHLVVLLCHSIHRLTRLTISTQVWRAATTVSRLTTVRITDRTWRALGRSMGAQEPRCRTSHPARSFDDVRVSADIPVLPVVETSA
jgi:hypothetical protein